MRRVMALAPSGAAGGQEAGFAAEHGTMLRAIAAVPAAERAAGDDRHGSRCARGYERGGAGLPGGTVRDRRIRRLGASLAMRDVAARTSAAQAAVASRARTAAARGIGATAP